MREKLLELQNKEIEFAYSRNISMKALIQKGLLPYEILFNDIFGEHFLLEQPIKFDLLLDIIRNSTYSERDYIVFLKRYGLDGKGGATLKECAKENDLSTERIRQIQYKTLRRLRQPGRRKMLAEVSPEFFARIEKKIDAQYN